MCEIRRVIGLALFSMGIGMFLVLLIPFWGYLLAAFIIVIGFWNLFL